jgi:hypothetical protein
MTSLPTLSGRAVVKAFAKAMEVSRMVRRINLSGRSAGCW